LSAVGTEAFRQMGPKCTGPCHEYKNRFGTRFVNTNPCVLNSFWVQDMWTSAKAVCVQKV